MKLGLDLIANQNNASRQAPEIDNGRLKREATIDSELEWQRAAMANHASPDVEYHGVKFDGTLRPSGDGGFFFRALTPCEFREHVKLEAHKRAAELLATDMENMLDTLKSELAVSEPELAEKRFGFSIDETGFIRPTGLSGKLTQREESILSTWMNEDKEFRNAAGEYIWMLAGLVDRTLEGLSAKCARYFSPAGESANTGA